MARSLRSGRIGTRITGMLMIIVLSMDGYKCQLTMCRQVVKILRTL